MDHLGGDGRGTEFVRAMQAGFREVKAMRTGANRAARQFDDCIELLVGCYAACDLAYAREALRAEFGFDRLGCDPSTVIARVLKRGKIRSDAEAKIVRNFVSNLGNEESIGRVTFERLAAILDAAGY
jgi:hypothetical protein